MSIFFVKFYTGSFGGGGWRVFIGDANGTPAGNDVREGDLALMFAARAPDNTSAVTMPAGWKHLPGSPVFFATYPGPYSTHSCMAAWKVLEASDLEANADFVFTGVPMKGHMLIYRSDDLPFSDPPYSDIDVAAFGSNPYGSGPVIGGMDNTIAINLHTSGGNPSGSYGGAGTPPGFIPRGGSNSAGNWDVVTWERQDLDFGESSGTFQSVYKVGGMPIGASKRDWMLALAAFPTEPSEVGEATSYALSVALRKRPDRLIRRGGMSVPKLRALDKHREKINDIVSSDFVHGTHLGDTKMAESDVVKITHRLGKPIQGWVITDVRGATQAGVINRVFEDDAGFEVDSNNEIWLKATSWGATITVRLWFY